MRTKVIKTSVLISALAITLFLVGCGNTTNNTTESKAGSKTENTADNTNKTQNTEKKGTEKQSNKALSAEEFLSQYSNNTASNVQIKIIKEDPLHAVGYVQFDTKSDNVEKFGQEISGKSYKDMIYYVIDRKDNKYDADKYNESLDYQPWDWKVTKSWPSGEIVKESELIDGAKYNEDAEDAARQLLQQISGINKCDIINKVVWSNPKGYSTIDSTGKHWTPEVHANITFKTNDGKYGFIELRSNSDSTWKMWNMCTDIQNWDSSRKSVSDGFKPLPMKAK